MNQPNELLRLTELVRDLQQNMPADGRPTLDALVHGAAESVPGAQHAGVTIATRRYLDTPSATDQYPTVLDGIQERQGEGPCLSAAWDQHTIRIDDLAADARWPRYRREALQRTPIRSVLSFRLFAFKHTAGALNLYASQTHAFDDESLEVGLTFATLLSLAWNIVQRNEQFRAAMASRDIIGQAKGMLMQRFGIGAVGAFELLKRLSQESNTPVADVAVRLVRENFHRRNDLYR
ncbi:GAF and ANTAR domain-containing protein [Mycobacterium sp. 852002-40037_SCH5390672]|uniref:GAF and ANTAR domain-containing protein n=1 Tax=Mycobacterium sp. 852002-40037_SCH5390672 TaxID=1834089 RepID=UPI000804880F|nr:GAF and ANTAR domain-containing protein [Mycobacterium sp. 852002-40037_SCH5390672]OBB99234.1 response regulator receiver protein [Mycobacterium sp. 852002-40037_SCH5390672]